MSTLITNIFNKVKEVQIVNRSLVMCQVAKEIVTSTLDSSKTKQELFSEVVRKVHEMDKVYLDACVKVTHQAESEVRQNLEFKILEFSANQLANLQKLSKNELRRLADAKVSLHSTFTNAKEDVRESIANKKNAITQILVSSRDRFSTTFNVKIQAAHTKVSTIKSKSVSIASAVKDNLKTRYSSVKNVASDQVRKTLQTTKLKEIIKGIELRANSLNNFTAQESANLKANLKKVRKYVSDQLTASQFLNYLKKNSQTQMENLRSALTYLKQTFDQNASTVKNFNAHTAKFAESIASKNKRLLGIVKTENKKLAANYFNKFEIELFYSPEESIKLVNKIRSVLSYVFGERQGDSEKVSNTRNQYAIRKLIGVKA